MSEFRIERDSMGEVKVPAKAYYGAQTQRAVENFPVSGQPLPKRLIHALGLVKAAAAIANRDGLVECSGQLRAIAVSLCSVANNIRWLGSGPRCGFYEIMVPDLQPGSSIMPGKVNPVMCESLMQVAARVIGNDQTIAFAGATGGQFELNIMMPVMGQAALESVQLLAGGVNAFVDLCVTVKWVLSDGSAGDGIMANRAGCERQVEQSLAMVTSLNPLIGYDAAAALAKEAFKSGKTVRQLCLEKMKAGTLKKKDSDSVVSEAELNRALDPRRMTEPEKS